jgi:hypothetical protein
VNDLVRSVDQLIGRVTNWTPSQWAASSSSGSSRADVVYALVQQLADLAASAEGQPHRAVPRIEHDLALIDQIRVMSADLVAAHAGDGELHRAANLVTATRRAL